jgi:glycogen debranching enzyme
VVTSQRRIGRNNSITITSITSITITESGGVNDDDALRRRAAETLAANWTGSYTVPSRTQYPHQWSWDAAFASLGLPEDRAFLDLRTLFRGQWADGRVPSIVFDPRADAAAYFPGPDVWQSRQVSGSPDLDTTGIVQPPLHAVAAREVYRRATDRAAAREALIWLYPRLAAQHDYLARARDVGGHGLLAIVHPWESGMDNSPAWDASIAAVTPDFSVLHRHGRRDRRYVPAEERPTDLDYARYLTLVESYRDGGYRDAGLPERHQFLVECPAFNAIYAAADAALADVATAVGADPEPHRERARTVAEALVKHLFDADAGTFLARDARTGRRSPAHTVAGLVPLMVADLPDAVGHALVAELTSPRFGPLADTLPAIPSYDRTGPVFDQARYWRGPVWFFTNWLVWQGLLTQGRDPLAEQLRAGTLDLARRSGIHEYYDAVNGAGAGIPGSSFTAAVTLHMLG